MMRRPPRSPLFPYTPLSRSAPARRAGMPRAPLHRHELQQLAVAPDEKVRRQLQSRDVAEIRMRGGVEPVGDRKSTRLNSSYSQISYAVFCLKKKNKITRRPT